LEETVYLLWFVRERTEGEDTELLIGVYRTEEDAQTAIQRLKDKPGFVLYPKGFQIHGRVLGKDSWTEGFARMLADKEVTD
jgi:hypothetical protein